MATNGKGTGMIGYNVQTVVDAKHHLIIAHEVTNVGHKHQLANVAQQAKAVTGSDSLESLPIAGTSPARKSWPARPPGSLRSSRSR
jgi:transposase